MRIGGLEKFSLIDYPGKIAAIVFTQGCNFRCEYCYNPELVFPTLYTPSIPESEVLSFLKKRKGKLEALVITGGEPTLQHDLIDFILVVKKLGYVVKLDTNGSNPDMLQKILKEKLVEYIAMDIKNPLTTYSKVVCTALEPERIQKSIQIIMNSKIPYEFRTTVIKSQIPLKGFEEIGKLIKGARLYALQKFIPAIKMLNPAFIQEQTYSDEEFERIQKDLSRYVQECVVR